MPTKGLVSLVRLSIFTHSLALSTPRLSGRPVLALTALRKMAIAPFLIGVSSLAWADAVHMNHTIIEIQAPQLGHDCVYFRLSDVSLADSGVPASGGYFAMPRTHPGFKEIYSLLLTAYATGMTVSARTTGAAVGGECGGYVGISWVITP